MSKEVSNETVGFDYDLYAAVLLSDFLGNEVDSESSTSNDQTSLSSIEKPVDDDKIIDISTNDVIWVPADKHPQIAPQEFASFLKNHSGNNMPSRTLSLDRKRSFLSQSVSKDSDLDRSLSEKKRLFLKEILSDKSKDQILDKILTSRDDSNVIPNKSDKSLLRRSALSARGPNRKSLSDLEERQKQKKSLPRKKSRSVQLENSPPPVINNESNTRSTNWDKSKGINLYDKPVNVSEWIDLGSASLSNSDSNGIISRVHDAESLLLQKPIDIDFDHLATHGFEHKETSFFDVTDIAPKPKDEIKLENISPKRPGIVRSVSNLNTPVTTKHSKPERRSSWLSGIFHDKKSQKSTKNPVIEKPASSTGISGLTSFISRSFKSSTNKVSTLPNLELKKSTSSSTIKSKKEKRTPSILSHKSRKQPPPELPPPTFMPNRLPLHLERAIYRLSHIKLAHPKRPLNQQVVISNFMFWYLSIQQHQQPMDFGVEPIKKPKTNRLFASSYKKRYPPPLQFNLPPIPTRHLYTNMYPLEPDDDDIPLSFYTQ